MGTKEQIEKKVFSYVEGHHMIAPGDCVVAGVSGGADSVCLLFLLLEYASRMPFSLAVVHVNHLVRSDAGEDAHYVEELCAQNGLPFYLEEADIRRLAEEESCSVEDAGRRVRYRVFGRVAQETGAARIAVAHNSNDNAETMLFHLFRGSGIGGISGIAPVREERGEGRETPRLEVIRPILCLERREVEAYLRTRGIAWRTDSTNASADYSRNRIRHKVLPWAEREVRGAVGHMAQTAALLRETEDFLEQETEKAVAACARRLEGEGREGGYAVEEAAFFALHGALQKRVLFALAKRLSPTGKDVSSVHIRDVLGLFGGETSRSVSLPYGIRAHRRYGEVFLEREIPEDGGRPVRRWRPQEVALAEELFRRSVVYALEGCGEMEFSAFFLKKGQEPPKNRYTKWLDYDKIKECPVIRSRQTGDYFTISDGAGGMWRKSLKDYMVTEKIPRQSRDEIPLVAAGSHVLWLAGWRISEFFKVDGNTERVLQIRLVQKK